MRPFSLMKATISVCIVLFGMFLFRVKAFVSSPASPSMARTRFKFAWRLLASSSNGNGNSTSLTNPTLDWKGASHSSSVFVTHVLIGENQAPCSVIDAVQRVVNERRLAAGAANSTDGKDDNDGMSAAPLEAAELLHLGSVWYLPASAPRDPALGGKPRRLGVTKEDDHNQLPTLATGDYLRVHHHPRRFPAVHAFDWSRRRNKSSLVTEDSNAKPGVIVGEDVEKGWLVIDKPWAVPVHMTVDNAQENVQACLYHARTQAMDLCEESGEDVYVSTPQRLDQNTSGLFVVATCKIFAAYFAKLLRVKTALHLDDRNEDTGQHVGGVHKVYRCLVCLVPPAYSTTDPTTSIAESTNAPWSVREAVAQLESYATNENKLVRHYLEPGIRAPKRFVDQPPAFVKDGKDASAAWLESLLRIRHVGQVCALIGNDAGQRLARHLWTGGQKIEKNDTVTTIPSSVPSNCQGVVELEVELLTGRTHQLRGQMAALGFPLVGDVQYGGAIPLPAIDAPMKAWSERLALQCCQLEFLDPDLVHGDDGVPRMVRSRRWNKFCLDDAWWTPLVEKYHEQMQQVSQSEVTTLASDVELNPKQKKTKTVPPLKHALPQRVQLSSGKNKYVLVRVTHPDDDKVQWFVKSAAPDECGGPYHGNVAQDLREWIEAAGYDLTVTGGGRIDYQPDEKRCIVYGFSYGFGKGDHARAAALIQDLGRIPWATYDNTDGLY